MPVPTIDGELYSEAGFVWQLPTEKYPLGRWIAPAGAKEPGIAAVGAPAYCEHPTTEILTVSYDLCDGRGIRRWRPGQALPWDLMNHLQDPDAPIEAHNAMFERLWVEKIAGPKHGWVVPDWRKWRCSMATAIVAQRPGALANLADVLGVSEQKDKEGKRLIKKFCIPQQPILGLVDKKTGVVKRPDQPARRIFPHDDPVDFEKLCEYCDQDVRAEMAVMAYLPPLSAAELRAWQATQEMNYRGLGVDRAGLRACIDVLGKVLDRYGQECVDITGFAITQLEKLKGWLGAYGVHSESLDSEHIHFLLKRTDLPPIARRVLELRALTGSASVKKTLAIENRCSSDNRLRDIIVHHGTRPGRPTGEGPQPLNLPKAGPKLAWCECGHPAKLQPQCPWCGNVMQASARKVWESGMVDHVVEIMGVGSLDLVERFFGDAMLAIQGCVRGLFEAAPGYQLVSTDYSSLQAVVAACLAGEQWRIDAFKRGDPIYLLGASKITGKPLQFYLDWFLEHGDHHPDRQYIGKVSELACGFQGWINSYRAFGSVETDEVIRAQILAWRDASPAIVEMWGGQWRGPPWRRQKAERYGLEGMFIEAVQSPCETFSYRGIDFTYDPDADCIEMLLPACNGHRRPLRYHEPRLSPSARASDELSISYMTWNTNPNYGARGWVRMPTWGGRLFENAVMGVEVDIQRFGQELLAAHGYPMVLGVYDEDVCEIPIGHPLTLGLAPVDGLDPYVQEIEHLLAIMPPEYQGWPIKATGGWTGKRYRKT